MIANINRNLTYSLFIALPFILVAMVLYFLVKSIITAKKKGEYVRLKMILSTVASILIAGMSWIFNIGWIRFFLTLILMPFIHAVIFLATNLYVSKYITKSARLKVYNIIFCATYLLCYILLPDGGDIGSAYVFFGLIHNDAIAMKCLALCNLAAIAHIVAFILQIIEIINTKVRINSQKGH